DGRRPHLPGLPEGTALRVTTERGDHRDVGAGLPVGAHTLQALTPDGRSCHATLLVVPDRFPAPPGRCFGLLVQLYSVLSERSWGMGDLADLADLAAWAGRTAGAGFLQLNPLHTAVPATADEATDPSPYRPSSRRFTDPVHLRVEQVPEYGYLTGEARERTAALLTAAAGLREAVLRKDAPIDRDAVWDLKHQALELLRTVPLSPGRQADYDSYVTRQGTALDDHALWSVLAELHGPDWRSWP
ncbi:4-alpha-glucanotransferase, partial [Streptomyces sparsus]